MPFEPHPSFATPSDRDTRIWRYLTLAKLVSMLHARALFFPRSDRLGDPFEGSYPKMNPVIRVEILRAAGLAEEAVKQSAKHLPASHRNFRRFVAISCWHMNDFESAALWDLYGRTGEAVAIQSTLGGLIDTVAAFAEPVFIGAVRYIDYDRDAIPEGNVFTPFLFKRRSFEHDRELRAMVVRWPRHTEGKKFDQGEFWAQETIVDGVAVSIDSTRLVHRVYISPTAPGWFLSVVRAVAIQFGLPGDVCTQSRLGEDPVF